MPVIDEARLHGSSGLHREGKPGKNRPRSMTAKETKLAELRADDTLSTRANLEGVVRIQMQALWDIMNVTKEKWPAWIKQENERNRTNMVQLTENDYVDIIKRSDSTGTELGNTILGIAKKVLLSLKSNLLVDALAIQVRKQLIDASASVTELSHYTKKYSGRYAGIYQEIEDCITSLNELTCTRRNENTQTTSVVMRNDHFGRSEAAQLRLMRACLDARRCGRVRYIRPGAREHGDAGWSIGDASQRAAEETFP